MARNANNQASNSNKIEQEALHGSQIARIVQVIFLGVQEQRAFQGQSKPDVDQVRVTYELSHAFMADEAGNPLADKPRWVSETFPFLNADGDLATSTKRYKAFNPTAKVPADHVWSDALLGQAIQVQLSSRLAAHGKHAGKTFTDVKGVTPPATMPGYEQPALVNPPVFFDPADDEVDVEVFNSFPDWLQELLKGAKDYAGSALATALGGATAPPKAAAPAPAPTPAPAPEPVQAADAGYDAPY
jgi:hypothetical protein